MSQCLRFFSLTCLVSMLTPAALADTAQGLLAVFTMPGDASIYVDGQRKGNSPASQHETFKIHLPEGEHTLRAEKDGFDAVERTLFIGAGTEKTVKLSLAPEIEMVAIEGGCFIMGSAEDENERDRDEGPQHEVCLQPFEIGRYELTFAQWDACVTDGGCEKIPSDEGWGRGQRPVINISWQQAQEYLKWLNNCGGQTGYRLPTEAEWEYAARAGTTTPFSTGECISTDQANFDGTFEYAGCPEPTNLDLHQTQPVGSYPPNAWGLYDMHGNVNEFVADCWNDSYHGAPEDGSAWLAGNCTRRVLRGGSWYGDPGYLRSAYRCRSGPAFGHRTIGLRLARTPGG